MIQIAALVPEVTRKLHVQSETLYAATDIDIGHKTLACEEIDRVEATGNCNSEINVNRAVLRKQNSLNRVSNMSSSVSTSPHAALVAPNEMVPAVPQRVCAAVPPMAVSEREV